MKELWVPLSGAIAQQRKVDTIANNVANANTPGFKKDQLTFKEYITTLEKGYDDIDMPNKEWAPSDFYKSYGAEHAKVKVDASYTDFQQGQLAPTGNSLDIGLRGKGFLEVLTPNGPRLTRRGILSINSEGTLVTENGYPVLSKSGAPDEDANNRFIKIPNGTKSVSFTLQGDMYADNQQVAKLNIIELKDINALRKEGNSLYINPSLDNVKQETSTSIHQGFVEQSNVNAVAEMSELIKAHRHFEAIQNVIKTYDQISQKGVNEISKF
ncbi:flagellar basal-body rod protein FlgF [Bacteriovorax sp. Seq25_V]|uniref:flagellar basal-body rod protein FlgF n=1 Tax=Bacteriovorax sp. Seq25_V TaxID=1201288 RepID=UPI000389EF65|nr:flagellar basal-body rod protein FlgF [Bacteriovorax sp. Seq25_V]EQC43534.1 flagellar basal-body rod protein FlgF [Bacteriovorax sp. Seq25_V]